jgi:hypothetical protein
LRGLTDVNFGTLPDIGKDQYTVKYDYLSNEFMLLPDNSGLPDAPIDGLKYVREDSLWVECPIQDPAPEDGKPYALEDGAWVEVPTSLNTLDDVDITGLAPNKILKWDGFIWTTSDDAGGIPDAPSDTTAYR